ncbi:hypothetical protein NBRC116583_08710 [Arenicella sp. 4NH20-0111]|uniref:hypothetical protein n=1 Tax=Arenicella sp. 4NH20-0111 TaxID=3127648 RepID=UPI003101D9C9
MNKSTITFLPSGAITFKDAKNCTGRLMLQDANRNPIARNYIRPNLEFAFQRSTVQEGKQCSFFGFFTPQENRDYFFESDFEGGYCRHKFYEIINDKKVMLPIKVSLEHEHMIYTENSPFCNSDNTTLYENGEFSIPLINWQPQPLEIPIIL